MAFGPITWPRAFQLNGTLYYVEQISSLLWWCLTKTPKDTNFYEIGTEIEFFLRKKSTKAINSLLHVSYWHLYKCIIYKLVTALI